MEAVSKNFFLTLSKSAVLNKAAKRWGMGFGASKVVGGQTFEKAIPIIKKLNEQGLCVTVDHLGEFVTSKEEAISRTEECITTVQAISREGLNSQVSVKMTSLGLDIDKELVVKHMKQILTEAKKYNIFVTIDMEDESRCQATLDIFKQLKAEFDNVGTVIQSYLFRSDQDLNILNEFNPNLRLVKGAYKESPEVAFMDKSDVDKNLKHLINKHLLNGNYTAVASHDDEMINYTKQVVREHDIPKDQFEFQMLYGMRSQTQLDLVNEGYKMRVYVPYGDDWYGYFMRRLAERPANVAFVLKGMFKR
ncbi:proline dehydrogenase family protein [Bacillus solimangrovi]|uniref:proline dehydrogenase n=1 Tax=Bacillus solimangrovi TaxID=1305675 RepID=A0A1E5LGD0_9BACI|nr:proline dehydrogenase [Bacillus solimangrovi]OEH93131.1 proline dehydrogenase [Bacillus solimangrovi]